MKPASLGPNSLLGVWSEKAVQNKIKTPMIKLTLSKRVIDLEEVKITKEVKEFNIEDKIDKNNLKQIKAPTELIRYMSLWNSYVIKANPRYLQILRSLDRSADVVLRGFLKANIDAILDNKVSLQACRLHCVRLLHVGEITLETFYYAQKMLSKIKT